jgi:tRNA (cmo5U34)-methyltransferase
MTDLALSRVKTAPPLEIHRDWSFEYGAIAERFDRHVREQLPFYDLATDLLAVIARHYVPRRGLVYDVGASTGNVGRAIAPVLDDRCAKLIPVEASAEMAAAYAGPQRGNLVIADALDFDFQPFDLMVCFLTLMFFPVAARRQWLDRVRSLIKPGGALVIVDKLEPGAGYAATVLWRMILSAKVAAAVDPGELIAKELSLGGVQRPLDPAVLGLDAVEWFRCGDFAGWLIEGPRS